MWRLPALIFVLLLVACSGDKASDNDVLHLRGYDIREADFKAQIIAAEKLVPEYLDSICETRDSDKERINRSQGDLFRDSVRDHAAGVVLKPGQIGERESEHRTIDIMRDLCK